MTEKKKKKGGFLIALGILLLAGAAGLTAYNLWDGERASAASIAIEEKIAEQMPEEIVTAPEYWDPADPEMPTFEVDGQKYIGIVEIPSLEISLPVMDSWDENKLEIAACFFWGSYKTDNLVICAHNYVKFFAPIRGLGMGEDVYFITPEGYAIHYVTANRETLQPTQVDEMITNERTAEDGTVSREWDLTLFTCYPGGQTRCAVRCIRVSDDQEAAVEKKAPLSKSSAF